MTEKQSPLARAALVAVFALAALLATRQVDSLDVGFHLKAGNWILDGHGWPRTDPFSYTMTDHDYVDGSWGYQVLIALVERAAGAAGLVILNVALILGTFFLLVRSARVASSIATPFFALVAVLACEMRFEIRPEILSYFFLALTQFLLARRDAGARDPMWTLPAIFLAWANCHALFVLGLGLLACRIAGGVLETRRLDRPLAKAALACALACVVNPYGLEGFLFPFTLLTRFSEANPFAREIGEFVSPFTASTTGGNPFQPWLPLWSFRVFTVLAGLAAIVLAVRKRFASALAIVVFAIPAVSMIRNMPILIVAALPVTITAFASFEPALARRLPRVRAAVWIAVLAVATLLGARVATDAYFIDTRRASRIGLDWNRGVLPIDAVEFVKRAGIRGRPINHLNFGGWLMWGQDEPVYIDGRLEVVGEEFFRRYRVAFSSNAEFAAEVQRVDARWVIAPYATFPKLLEMLTKDPRWTLAHADRVAAVFVRSDADAARFVDKKLPTRDAFPAIDLATLPGFPRGRSRPTAIARFASGFVAQQDYPSEDHFLSLFHLYRGELELAAARCAQAIERSDGRYVEIYRNLGAVLWRMQRLEETRACYRIVLEENPDDRLARERAGA